PDPCWAPAPPDPEAPATAPGRSPCPELDHNLRHWVRCRAAALQTYRLLPCGGYNPRGSPWREDFMKYAIVIPDGCADDPQPSLGGKTPLQAARLPNMDRIAAMGLVGRADNVPRPLTPA